MVVERRPLYTGFMATAVKKLDLHVGELVEIDGRRYEVVPARDGDGLALESPITPVSELDADAVDGRLGGGFPAQLAADEPPDGEGYRP